MAAIHAASFTTPRPWTRAEIDTLLSGGAFAICHAAPAGTSQMAGFVMGRVTCDEAELLTIATAPFARQQGLGRRLLADFTRHAHTLGARTAFLEVAADNTPALGLYRGAGWIQAGLRRNYYASGLDALVMRRGLGHEID